MMYYNVLLLVNSVQQCKQNMMVYYLLLYIRTEMWLMQTGKMRLPSLAYTSTLLPVLSPVKKTPEEIFLKNNMTWNTILFLVLGRRAVVQIKNLLYYQVFMFIRKISEYV
jgi:hypothetical protein